mgnify:CR=1 FL=1
MEIKKNKIRSEAMRLFNYLKKTAANNSEAMRQAWQVAKCKAAMKKSEVILTFRKKGEEVPTVRFATLCSDFFTYVSKGVERKANALQIAFYDLNAETFKSFIATNLIQFRAVA